MQLTRKRAIALLIIAAATETTMVSAVNVISTRTINCIGNITYLNAWTIQSTGNIAYKMQTFDLNHDGRVDIIDVAIVAKAFGSCLGHERWDPSFDVNGDGKVGETDLSMIAGNCWGE